MLGCGGAAASSDQISAPAALECPEAGSTRGPSSATRDGLSIG